jgi:hypothetical protein
MSTVHSLCFLMKTQQVHTLIASTETPAVSAVAGSCIPEPIPAAATAATAAAAANVAAACLPEAAQGQLNSAPYANSAQSEPATASV